MKDFLIDSNTVYEKGMQGYTALTIIEENLNRLDELLKEASNEINKHDELNMMYYQSLESDIQYLRDYKNKYQSFIGGTYNVNGDGGFVGEYKDTVDDPYYKQKEALLDKLGDLKLEDITVDNKLGITTNYQAFVGHTTMVKDTVNIRDILGFGNISDNIKKQYEESKALIEKYNEGLNTYNEADYPSILPSFAKKLWYNLTKKKEKTIDNYDDYLDAIIKSGDFNFETEGEKKLSIGLDFIPILGIEKMTLEGLLGEDLVSGRDLNGLERILSVAPAGVGAIAKVKNAIKLGEIGGKVEGSISFGMNGGGQLEDILSKLKKSKAEEDMVAKEAVTIDKGAGKAAVNPSVEDILSGKARIPSKKKFDEWFDALTVEELETLCADSTSLKRIKDGLRAGGNHEWYKVSQVVKAKKWGVSLNDIKYDAVTKVNGAKDNDLWFVDIESKDGRISGRHSDGLKAEESTHTSIENSASSLAHKELDALFDKCETKEEYLEKLNKWADDHLVITKKGKGLNNAEDIVAKGRDALPESIRRHPNE